MDGTKHFYRIRQHSDSANYEWTNVKITNILSSSNSNVFTTVKFMLCAGDDYAKQWKCKATQLNDIIMVNINTLFI